MKFQTTVEPPERMHGLEVPEPVADALGGGRRPPVLITVNQRRIEKALETLRGAAE